MKELHLIDDAKRAWKFFSVQAMSASIAIQGTWTAIPDSLRDAFPPKIIPIVSITLLILGIIGRLFKQDPPCQPKDEA